jgi:hypothetical protein
LRALTVRAWRLHLETPGVFASVPMLRGVWGAALRARQRGLYEAVFEGGPEQTPRYLMRPAPADARPAPALEFLLFGPPDEAAEQAAWTAWDDALATGLGPRRRPGRLTEVRPLAWDGTALAPSRRQPGFCLDGLPWPGGDPEAPCRLVFDEPLRLMRDGRLIVQPTLADLTLAALRRLQALAGPAAAALWEERGGWLELARRRPASWAGRPLDLVRYSGRQRREVEMHGVSGELRLPQGPGPLAELLAAATWLHLGKGTVHGLGRLAVRPGAETPRADEPATTEPAFAEA